MKKTIRTAGVAILAVSLTGCATPYMTDRGRDAGDIFSCSYGMGLGAAARVGPAKTGLIAQFDLAGYRGGQSFSGNPMLMGSFDLFALGYGIERFDGYPNWVELQKRGKNFGVEWSGPPIIGVAPLWKTRAKKHCAHMYQIDIVAALGLSLRLGFNPAELLDFALGWFGPDIIDDDMEAKKKRESDKNPEATTQGSETQS